MTHERQARVLRHGASGIALELSNSLVPRTCVGRRNTDRTQHVVEHQHVEGILADDVVVERHHRHAELAGNLPHRDVFERRLAGQLKRRLYDLRLGQRARPSAAPFNSDKLVRCLDPTTLDSCRVIPADNQPTVKTAIG